MVVAPVRALPVVDLTATGSATASGRSALPVKVISDGSIPVAPVQAQGIVFVTAPFPVAPVETVPVVVVAGPPGPFTEIPVILST